jgi:uncharacterized protein YPO0396
MVVVFAFAIFVASLQPTDRQAFAKQREEFERRRRELRNRERALNERRGFRPRGTRQTVSPEEQAKLDEERDAIRADMNALREEELAARDELQRGRGRPHADLSERRRQLKEREQALSQRRRAIIARRRELAELGEGPDSKEMLLLKDEEATLRKEIDEVRAEINQLHQEQTTRDARPGRDDLRQRPPAPR